MAPRRVLELQILEGASMESPVLTGEWLQVMLARSSFLDWLQWSHRFSPVNGGTITVDIDEDDAASMESPVLTGEWREASDVRTVAYALLQWSHRFSPVNGNAKH